MNDKFSDFWRSLEPIQKTELADRAETSVAYLSQLAHGHRCAGKDIIQRLVKADEQISLSWFFEAA